MGWTRPKKRMNLVLENRLMDTFKETFTAVVERVGLVIDGAGVIVIVVGLIGPQKLKRAARKARAWSAGVERP